MTRPRKPKPKPREWWLHFANAGGRPIALKTKKEAESLNDEWPGYVVKVREVPR
jgi:hypothetical protein